MENYQREFLQFAVERGALRFGEFALKSGRLSPYFYNAGDFNSGQALARLGEYYAAAITAADIKFDLLFGPAYKGIPLATAAAIALYRDQGRDVPWCFNRKEAKDHGEGGGIVGSPLGGRVLIVDDVITAGTAVRESMALLDAAGAELAGVAIALDRQERGAGEYSAIREVEQSYGAPVISIVKLDQLAEFLAEQVRYANNLVAIQDYRARYGEA